MDQVIEVITSKIGWASDGADYTHFSSWYSACEPALFNVGIVRGNDFMHGTLFPPEPFHELRHPSYADYLLLHTTGSVIAWSYQGKTELFEDALDENSRQKDWFNRECINSIKSFCDRVLQGLYELDIAIYADANIQEKSSILLPTFVEIDEELIRYFAAHPEALHSLHWREFEELLSVLFERLGFVTELGPGRADGGVDLRLIQRSDIGEMLILVQAKKQAKERKIQLDPVKALWASVEDEQANKGVLVSTAEFIPAAKKFAARRPYRLELAGPEKLQSWLKMAG